MSSDFPKLHEKLDEIRSEFNAILKQKSEAEEIEEVEIHISESNFGHRSPKTQGILALVNCLEELAKRLDNEKNHKDRNTQLDTWKQTVKENVSKHVAEQINIELEKQGVEKLDSRTIGNLQQHLKTQILILCFFLRYLLMEVRGNHKSNGPAK